MREEKCKLYKIAGTDFDKIGENEYMSRIQDNIIKLFNQIFRKNRFLMLANVSKQNYDEYHRTYDTLSKIFAELNDIDAYLVGGISSAIQTNQDLYRQNSDIDIMCKEEDLPKIIKKLQEIGYSIEDKRGVKTNNIIDANGNFKVGCHDINTNIKSNSLLDVGLFVYKVNNDEVTTFSYAFDERIGKFVGTEKIIPKELFDMIYNNIAVDYKGIKLKTQSKEYTYMVKSRGTREKDKLDASVIEPTLDVESKEKIVRIKELEAKTKEYKLVFDKDGRIESRFIVPSLEDKVNSYLTSLYMNSSTKTPEQIINNVLQSKQYDRVIIEHPEIHALLKEWREKTKHYTYKDKIKLITNDYSKRLQGFDRKAIDNALDFLQRRYQNQGKDNDDIELDNKAKEIFKLMTEYGQSIKRIFVDNNIDITHITSISPEKLEGGVLRKSIDRANNYETERVDGVFASSTPVDGNNPYIARNSSGMIRLGKSTYIYGNDNIEVTQDSEGKKHAVLKQPNYIYHIKPTNFNPVCNLTIDSISHDPIFEFSEEWISDSEIDISDFSQVRDIEQVKDITNLLEHYTILCDTQSQGLGMKARQSKSKNDALKFIDMKIKDGSVRNINQEAGINDRELSNVER